MAIVTLDSKFQPFNYDQYIEPLAQATQAQNDTESKYADMQSQATSVKAFLDPVADADVLKTYDDYSKQLEGNINNLMQNGLNPSSRQALFSSRNDFNNTILPIEIAVQNKQKAMDTYNNKVNNDQSLISSRPVSNIPVSEFIKDPSLTINTLSGNQLTAKSATEMAALAKSKQSVKYNPVLGGQYYERAVAQGYSPSQILSAVAGGGPKEIQQIVKNLWSENDISSYTPDAQERAIKYILDGLYAGVQNVSSSPVANKQWDINAQEQSQERLYKYKADLDAQTAAAAAAAQQPKTLGGVPINTNSMISPNLQGDKGVLAAKNAETALGTNMLGGKKAKTININYTQSGGGEPNSIGGNYSSRTSTIKASLWNGDNLKTRSQFIAQGKSPYERTLLNQKYNEINSSIGGLGLATPDQLAVQGRNWTASALRAPIVNTYKGAAPLQMQTLRMGYKPNEAKETLQNLVSMQEGRKGDLSNIKEVSSFDNQGNLKFSPNRVNKSTFMDDKGEVNAVPQFYASPNPKVGGILFTHLGTTYYVSNSNLGANQDELNRYTTNMEIAKQQKQNLLRNNGKVALNSNLGKTIEGALDSNSADFLKENYINLGWSAKSPSVDITTSNPKTELQ